MAEDMVYRAGRALVPFYYGATGDGDGNGDCWKGRADDLARAALLAALDPEDEALVQIVMSTGLVAFRDQARTIIGRLAKHAQGEQP